MNQPWPVLRLGIGRGVLDGGEAGPERVEMEDKDGARKSGCVGAGVRAGRHAQRDKPGAGLASCRLTVRLRDT